MFASNHRDDYSVYANQGFNCNMWAGSAAQIRMAKNAGMMSGYSLAQFVNDEGWAYENMDRLERDLATIVNSDVYDSMLFFYWDNENSWGIENWEANTQMLEIARRLDGGNHPMHVLQGNYGVARGYDNDTYDFQDLTGAYAAGDANALVVLNNLQNRKTPVNIAQINRGVGNQMRPRFWGAVAKGARGFGMWRDAEDQPVEQMEWWDDFPQIRAEVDALLPVLRQPHWVDWTVAVSPDNVECGGREYEGGAYLIIANPNGTAINPSFTISGLSYTAEIVRDAFSGWVIKSNPGNSFNMEIAAHDARIIRLVPPESEMPTIPKAPTNLRIKE
jgi:hypothetical protein